MANIEFTGDIDQFRAGDMIRFTGTGKSLNRTLFQVVRVDSKDCFTVKYVGEDNCPEIAEQIVDVE